MARNRITCPFCHKTHSLRPGQNLPTDASCPKCGEYLVDDDLPTHRGQAFNDDSERQSERLQIFLLAGACVLALTLSVVAYVVVSDRSPKVADDTLNTETPDAQTEETSHSPATEPSETTHLPQPEETITTASPSIPQAITDTSLPQSQQPVADGNTGNRPPERSADQSNSPSDKTVARQPGWFTFSDTDNFQFEFEVRAEHESGTEVITGRSTYSVQQRDMEISDNAETEKGSGTAFVITSDGHLLSCAHVVDRASTVNVKIGNRDYPARIIASDPVRDLALLKIEATNLHPVKLADSGQVRLGQEVRVIGFPLSRLLGTGIKVTTGTVSGIVQNPTTEEFQIDAAVNPGNSGGPVFRSDGSVVGVASSRLSGADVSGVGFCVPSNQAREFLNAHGLSFSPEPMAQPLDGPSLVELVSPAVAYVSVEIGPSPNDRSTRLSFHSVFHDRHEARLRAIPPRFPTGGNVPTIHRGTLDVTRFGNLLEDDDGPQLPYLIGAPSQLPFVPLPQTSQSKWTVSNSTALVFEEEAPNQRGLPEMRFRFPFDRQAPRSIVKSIPAVETSDYELVSLTGDKAVIKQDYEFRTTKPEEGQIFRMGGAAKFTIDIKRGITSHYDFSGVYSVESQSVTLKVPLTIKGTGTHQKPKPPQSASSSPSVARTTSPPERSVINSSGTAEKLDYPVKVMIPEMGWGIKSLAFHPNNKFVAAGKADDYVELYDIDTGNKIFTAGRLRELGTILSLKFTPNGKQLLAGGYRGLIQVWNVADNGLLTPVGTYAGHKRNVTLLEISPNSEFVISGGGEKQAQIWDLKTLEEKFTTPSFEANEFAFRFLNDEQVLVSDGRVLREFNVSSGELARELTLRNTGSTTAICFSPDGKTVAVTDGYSVLRWSTSNGKAEPELKGKEVLWDVEFTRDSQTLVCGGRGHLVFWNLRQQERDGHLMLGDSIQYVKPLTLSSDGKYVACYPSSAGQSLWVFELPNVD
ncbi:putative serine protease HtrA [Thalassoglobus neptunius]|uniref:Putative serine protease HtrA n=1 Tax=Thalassoglobus neptunius TaxID=1938619 RepID=A0A5C5X4M5_9PLAN|nr:trypsin-like peptidase domain-containing protein [Thalassoglobus neptunius]TWT57956.1 putative serine protease HtrA [Thalassoglobus neptunius]